MKILLVDGNKIIAIMMSKYLVMKGHECVTSNDGRNCLTLIEQQKFDAILLDTTLIEFTAFDIIDALINTNELRNKKIIFFTPSSVSDSRIIEYLKKGVHSCIKKPRQLETLLDVTDVCKQIIDIPKGKIWPESEE